MIQPPCLVYWNFKLILYTKGAIQGGGKGGEPSAEAYFVKLNISIIFISLPRVYKYQVAYHVWSNSTKYSILPRKVDQQINIWWYPYSTSTFKTQSS